MYTVFLDNFMHSTHFIPAESSAPLKLHRIKPEFCHVIVTLDMDMQMCFRRLRQDKWERGMAVRVKRLVMALPVHESTVHIRLYQSRFPRQ